MGKTYPVFTVESGTVSPGARVSSYALKGVDVTIPAILVGERGRGRELGILPVSLPPALMEKWLAKAEVSINAASIGKTKAGRPKLFAAETPTTDEAIIAVLRTKIGFRGSNSHTGDRVKEWWELDRYYRESAQAAGAPIKDRYTREEVEEYGPRIAQAQWGTSEGYRVDTGFQHRIEFDYFPGQVLVEGWIAQGAAGRMGSGQQFVALIPKGKVFRTAYSGRLYGAPKAHYYLWTGQELLCATWEERCLTDIF